MTAAEFGTAAWRRSSYSTNQGNCVEVAFTGWYTSSYSSNQGNCVEVGHAAERVGVRDSKNPGGPVLAVAPSAFAALVRVART